MIRNDPAYFRFLPPPKPQPRLYGEVPGSFKTLSFQTSTPSTGVPIGLIFFSYEEMRWSGIHYDTCAGISVGMCEGCYSVVLNGALTLSYRHFDAFPGGYDDDIDNGDTFVMSGSGGRDLKGTASNPKVK